MYDFTFTYKEEFEQLFQRTMDVLTKHDKYIVSCILVDDQKIQEINRDYRKIDKPTDVISFALLDDTTFFLPEVNEGIELGDIFINIDACKRQALAYGHSFQRELCFLFVHGLLHLFGYDHMDAVAEKEMIGLQKEILDEVVTQ